MLILSIIASIFFEIFRTKLKRIVNLKLHNDAENTLALPVMSLLLRDNFIYDVTESQLSGKSARFDEFCCFLAVFFAFGGQRISAKMLAEFLQNCAILGKLKLKNIITSRL